MDEWTPPESIEDAQTEMTDLLEACETITLSLRTKKADAKSRRMPQNEYIAYQDWKQRAIFARTKKMAQYRRLKTWIEEARRSGNIARNRAEAAARVEGIERDDLLPMAYHTIRSLGARLEWQLSSEEQIVVDALRDYLRANGARV